VGLYHRIVEFCVIIGLWNRMMYRCIGLIMELYKKPDCLWWDCIGLWECIQL
jgi:hypothetical protein